MPVFVFVGNPAVRKLRDRETGAVKIIKADREESDEITMRTRDGKVAAHFVRDNPVRVENQQLVSRLRANNHFFEVVGANEDDMPVEERPGDKPVPKLELVEDVADRDDTVSEAVKPFRGVGVVTDAAVVTDEG